MKKCILCLRREATVPDREREGRPIKRICSECHKARLLGDIKRVLAYNFDPETKRYIP